MNDEDKPMWVLLKHYDDDTMSVVCHFHHEPSEAELDDMFEHGDWHYVLAYAGTKYRNL